MGGRLTIPEVIPTGGCGLSHPSESRSASQSHTNPTPGNGTRLKSPKEATSSRSARRTRFSLSNAGSINPGGGKTLARLMLKVV